MSISNKQEAFLLFAGDIFFFILALWVTLVVRYFEVPNSMLLYNHLLPFSFLFLVWILIFFIAGLYGKHTLILKHKLPGVIFRAQLTNVILAAIFFFFIPIFGIAPKTNLFIYLIISFGLIVLWRLFLFPRLRIRKRQRALLIGGGIEVEEIELEVNTNRRYALEFVASINLDRVGTKELIDGIEDAVTDTKVSLIVLDAKDERVVPALSHIYEFILQDIKLIDLSRLYEEIFDRIPVSFVRQQWLIDNVSLSSKPVYDTLKRALDISVGLVLGILSLVVYPVVYLAIKLDDGGALFSTQTRVGKFNKPVRLIKFRTMTIADDKGKWEGPIQNTVTKVGAFLRRTRIDELPQLWNVLGGSVSLIGPRPDFPDPVALYAKEISYYNIRHLIKPGLSGWAQIFGEHPHHGTNVFMTENKLSYDLYYVKNRSFILDIHIALRTIKTLFSRSGL